MIKSMKVIRFSQEIGPTMVMDLQKDKWLSYVLIPHMIATKLDHQNTSSRIDVSTFSIKRLLHSLSELSINVNQSRYFLWTKQVNLQTMESNCKMKGLVELLFCCFYLSWPISKCKKNCLSARKFEIISGA